MRLLLLLAVPPFVTTVRVPVLAFAGTFAVTFLAETTLKLAFIPSTITDDAPEKFTPAIVIVAPGLADVGVKLAIFGAEWRGPDLNRRHHGFQPCALPTELPRRGRAV